MPGPTASSNAPASLLLLKKHKYRMITAAPDGNLNHFVSGVELEREQDGGAKDVGGLTDQIDVGGGISTRDARILPTRD